METKFHGFFLEELSVRKEGTPKETMEILCYLNEREAARIMGVALQTLRNWRFQRRGPSYFVVSSRMIRYSLSSVIDFMEQRKINTERR